MHCEPPRGGLPDKRALSKRWAPWNRGLGPQTSIQNTGSRTASGKRCPTDSRFRHSVSPQFARRKASRSPARAGRMEL